MTSVPSAPSPHRLPVAIPALLALCLLSFGCPAPEGTTTGGATQASSDPAGAPADGYFRWRLREDPPDLDPAQSSDTTSAAVLTKVHDGLVDFDHEMNVVPAVAESWEISDDGRVYTFQIRDDVYFHDGGRVTADDVAWSFHRTLSPEVRSERQWVLVNIDGAPEYVAGEADTVRGIEVVDPTTVRLTLSEPFAPFIGLLTMEAAAIIPKSVYSDPDEGYLRHPVGCGPFKFKAWQQSNFLELEAFDKYYGGRPKLNGIRFRFIENLPTALLEYENGGLELLDEAPPGQRRRLARELPEQYLQWAQLGVYYYGFNHAKPPFKDNRELRQAFNHAINRKYITEKLQEGKDIPAFGIMPPGLPGHRPESTEDPYDPAKAKRLLAEAGYPDGEGLPPITLHFNTNEGHKRVAQQVQQDLKAIGIEVKLDHSDWGSYLDLVEGTDEDPPDVLLYRMGWIADYPDPDNFMTVRLSKDYWGPRGNYSRFHDPRFEELIDRARQLTVMEERIPLYQEAERIAVEEAAWLFIYYYGEEALVKPYVRGFMPSPQGDQMVDMTSVWMEETTNVGS